MLFRSLTLAQQQQQNTQQQGQQNVSNLLDVGQSKQNLSLIPLQAQYNALSAEYNQGNTQSNAILNNTLQAQTQEQQMQEMEALTQQNQPAQTPWYQPLITGGLTALGTALGGPVGGALANGVSGLFGANSQPSSTTNYGSLFNTNSQLNLNSNFNSNLFQNSAPQFTGSFFGGK